MSYSLSDMPADADAQYSKSWVEIHTPVGDGFRSAFVTRVSDDGAAWASELGQFYRTDGKLVYRGVCDDAARTLVDFLDMFVSVSDNLLSQGVSHARQQALIDIEQNGFDEINVFDLQRAIFADFSRYNRDAYLYSLVTETGVHQLGPVPGNTDAYKRSYGFSTSWSFWVAADFAGVKLGDNTCANAMVFGMYPANYFIDYANLQAVDARFKQMYPDERETLGVGAVDPDSLMMAVRLESRGTARPVITEVTVRDPLNPSQVLYFEGEVDTLVDEVTAGWEIENSDSLKIDATYREHNVRPPMPLTIPPDSRFRLPLGQAPVVRINGVPQKPSKLIPLDYSLPLFPDLPTPGGQPEVQKRQH